MNTCFLCEPKTEQYAHNESFYIAGIGWLTCTATIGMSLKTCMPAPTKDGICEAFSLPHHPPHHHSRMPEEQAAVRSCKDTQHFSFQP